MVTEGEKTRDSNIELYRIILMLLIIAHHYVVNSGLINVMYQNPLSCKAMFLFIFSAWGKIGINCFILITGYFMCKSKITIKKLLKLLFEVEFYNIVIYGTFCFTGVTSFDLKNFIKAILPFTSIAQNFTGCFLLFYLFIPYVNKLIESLNKKEFEKLIVLMFLVYSLMGNIPGFKVVINYITLYVFIYCIGAYIRLYPIKWFFNKRIISLFTLGTILLCICSVICCLFIGEKADKKIAFYFVTDSNKVLAVLSSISLFLFFKNLNVKYNKFINEIATSIFGVLLIHSNSDVMRKFLWNDLLNNIEIYYSNWLIPHAILSVFGVFIVCLIIDQIRINTIERILFKEDGFVDKLIYKCKNTYNRLELKMSKM